MTEDQQRSPRLGVALDVTLEAGGSGWQGRIVDLSPYTAKVRSLTKSPDLAPGTNVDLRFALPEQSPLSLTASVDQTNPESIVLNLKPSHFQRVKDLVDSLLEREWQQVLNELQGLTPTVVTVVSRDEPGDPEPEPPREPAREPSLEPPAPVQESARITPEEPPAPVQESVRITPEESPAPLPEGASEADPLPELLAQVGLGGLRLPTNGELSPQWRDFLLRLGSGGSKTEKPTSKRMAKR